MNFLKALLSGNEAQVDSVTFGSLVVLFALCGFTFWDVVIEHHQFNIVEFTAAASGAVGASAGSKRLRDGIQGVTNG